MRGRTLVRLFGVMQNRQYATTTDDYFKIVNLDIADDGSPAGGPPSSSPTGLGHIIM